MLHFGNCYYPAVIFTLAELRAGMSHIVLIIIWGVFLYRMDRRSIVAWSCFAGYTAGMFFFQRRLASGFPVRYTSLQAWRSSPDNFRRTSKFLRTIRAKPTPAGGASEEGFGSRPVAVITGGERGIGEQVVGQLIREDVDVILCCPFHEEAEKTIAKLLARMPTAKVRFLKMNLNNEDSVRAGAEEILRISPRIDLLINNAGLAILGGHHMNKRGNETVLSINFIGHVLLTELLLDRLKASGPSRIVNVASLMHLDACIPGPCKTALDALAVNCDPASPYHSQNYSLSKLLLVCYTRDLARRLQGSETTAAVLHPGVALTSIYLHGTVFMKAFLRTVFKFPGESAEVVLHVALADEVQSGSFYADCQQYDSLVSPLALDAAHNARLTRALRLYFGLDGPHPSTLTLPQAVAATQR